MIGTGDIPLGLSGGVGSCTIRARSGARPLGPHTSASNTPSASTSASVGELGQSLGTRSNGRPPEASHQTPEIGTGATKEALEKKDATKNATILEHNKKTQSQQAY